MTFQDDPNLYKKLLRQGVSSDEIENLYRKLRDRGYGGKEAEKRFQKAVRYLRERNKLCEPRSAEDAQEDPLGVFGPEERFHAIDLVSSGIEDSNLPLKGEFWKGTKTVRGRSGERLPTVPSSLRRKINRWAFARRLRIVGLRERLTDLLSYIVPRIKDYINDDFAKEIIVRKGFRTVNPTEMGLLDTFDALYHTSRLFLGLERRGTLYLSWGRIKEIERNVVETLEKRDPFGLEFLRTFSFIDEAFFKNIEYIEISLRSEKRVESGALIWIVRQLYRFTTITEQVSVTKVKDILITATDVNMTFDRRRSLRGQFEAAENLFMTAFTGLRSLKRSYYPALLKMINGFYEEEDRSEVKMRSILAFLELTEEAVLNYTSFIRQEEERKEEVPSDEPQEEGEEIRLDAPAFSNRFGNTLTVLGILFPDSRIEDLENFPYLLPYFDMRVFRTSLIFYHHGQTIENVHREDPLGLVMILHRILDNLLNSLNEYNLEKILDTPSIGDMLLEIKQEWKDIYIRLFEPYLQSLSDYARELEPGAASRAFRVSSRARSTEEDINLIRNYCIRGYGHVLTRRTIPHAPRLYLLAERLNEILSSAGDRITPDIVKSDNTWAQRIYQRLSEHLLVDYRLHAEENSFDFKPVTCQVKRYVELKHRSTIDGVPKIAQIYFFETLRRIAELYTYLLNAEDSFLHTYREGILIAGEEERVCWDLEKLTEFRGGLRIGEPDVHTAERPEYSDHLTGFLNKNFFLKELPERVRSFGGEEDRLTIVMLDIDHFKWVNDELGHPAGDEVLVATAGLIRSHLRDTDIAIRFGGDEIFLLMPSSLETTLPILEELRVSQERAIRESETYSRLRAVTVGKDEFCATLSIGAVEMPASDTVDSAVEQADRALYEAKKERNRVMFIEAGPGAETSGIRVYRSTPME